MRRGSAVPVGLGVLALAFGVAFTTPSDAQVEAPFAATGSLGEQIVSRHLLATADDVALAREVDLDGWTGTTAGVWLVVDATLEGRVARTTVDADVLIDGVRYASTSRTSTDTVDGRVVDPGFPVTGSILVELPADVRDLPGARSAVLRIGPGGDSRLDSVIELTLDLTAIEVRETLERDTPRDGTS